MGASRTPGTGHEAWHAGETSDGVVCGVEFDGEAMFDETLGMLGGGDDCSACLFMGLQVSWWCLEKGWDLYFSGRVS